MARKPTGAGGVLGVLLVIGLVLLVVKWLLVTALILAVPFGAWWLWDRTRTPRPVGGGPDRRAELESLAVVDAGGGCGWCGSRVAHLDALGYPVLPVDAHRGDIEQALRPAA